MPIPPNPSDPQVTEEQIKEILVGFLKSKGIEVPKHLHGLLDKSIRVRMTLDKESDRGVALICTSLLDNRLKTLFKAMGLDGSAGLWKDAFGHNGPLGSFSGKSKMAFLLGWISERSMQTIDALRHIRNEFAHSDEPLSFNDEGIKAKMKDFKLYTFEITALPRTQFIEAFMGVLVEIDLRTMGAKHAISPAFFDWRSGISFIQRGPHAQTPPAPPSAPSPPPAPPPPAQPTRPTP